VLGARFFGFSAASLEALDDILSLEQSIPESFRNSAISQSTLDIDVVAAGAVPLVG